MLIGHIMSDVCMILVLKAKLSSKLAFAKEDVVKWNLQQALALIPHCRTALARSVASASASRASAPSASANAAAASEAIDAEASGMSGTNGKFQALCQLLARLTKSESSDAESENSLCSFKKDQERTIKDKTCLNRDKVLVFVERVAVAGPMAQLLETSLCLPVTHAPWSPICLIQYFQYVQ